MDKEIKELITIGKETNKLLNRLGKILTWTNMINVTTIIVIVLAIIFI